MYIRIIVYIGEIENGPNGHITQIVEISKIVYISIIVYIGEIEN